MGTIFYVGIAVTLVGTVTLIAIAFQKDKTWGLMSLFMVPPVGPLLFALTHWRWGRDGFVLTLIGLLATSYGLTTSDWWGERQYQKRLALQQQQSITGEQETAAQSDITTQSTPTDLQEKAEPIKPVENKVAVSKDKVQQNTGQGNKVTQLPSKDLKEDVAPIKSVATVETPPVSKAPAPTADKSSTTKEVEKKAVTQAPDAVAREKQVSSIPKTQPTIEPAKKSSAKILAYSVVDVANINSYIGKNVRVTDITDKIREAVLKDMHEKIVVFEKLFGSGGTVTFEIPVRDIKKLEVGTWKAKQ